MKLLQHRRLRTVLLCSAALLAGGAILLALALSGIRIPCIFNKVTGLYCPGCGNTRAVVALWQLDFSRALRCNLLFPVELFYLGWVAAWSAVRYLRGQGFGYRPPLPVLDILVLALILLWGIVRNLLAIPIP